VTELTAEELAEIEQRFEAFDYAQGTPYVVGVDALPPAVLLTQARARRAYDRSQADG